MKISPENLKALIEQSGTGDGTLQTGLRCLMHLANPDIDRFEFVRGTITFVDEDSNIVNVKLRLPNGKQPEMTGITPDYCDPITDPVGSDARGFVVDDPVWFFAPDGIYQNGIVIGHESNPRKCLEPGIIFPLGWLPAPTAPGHEIDLSTTTPPSIEWPPSSGKFFTVFSRNQQENVGYNPGGTEIAIIFFGGSGDCSTARAGAVTFYNKDDEAGTGNVQPFGDNNEGRNLVADKTHGMFNLIRINPGNVFALAGETPNGEEGFQGHIMTVTLPDTETKFFNQFGIARADVEAIFFVFPIFSGVNATGNAQLPTLSRNLNGSVDEPFEDAFDTTRYHIKHHDATRNVNNQNIIFTEFINNVFPICPFPSNTTYFIGGLIPDQSLSEQFLSTITTFKITEFPHIRVHPKPVA